MILDPSQTTVTRIRGVRTASALALVTTTLAAGGWGTGSVLSGGGFWSPVTVFAALAAGVLLVLFAASVRALFFARRPERYAARERRRLEQRRGGFVADAAGQSVTTRPTCVNLATTRHPAGDDSRNTTGATDRERSGPRAAHPHL